MVNNHGDCKSPKDRVVGPSCYMAMKMAEINGDPITTYIHWDPILQVVPPKKSHGDKQRIPELAKESRVELAFGEERCSKKHT